MTDITSFSESATRLLNVFGREVHSGVDPNTMPPNAASAIEKLLESLKKNVLAATDQRPSVDPDAPPPPYVAPGRVESENDRNVEAVLDGREDSSNKVDGGNNYYSTNNGGIPAITSGSSDGLSSNEALAQDLSEPDRSRLIQELNRPVALAEYIGENWGKWGIRGDAGVARLANDTTIRRKPGRRSST